MAAESRLQRACVRYAGLKGCIAVKLDGALAGMADYLFLLPTGRCWLVEFKAPDGVLSPRQVYMHGKLAMLKHPVSVVRSTAAFKELLAAYTPAEA